MPFCFLFSQQDHPNAQTASGENDEEGEVSRNVQLSAQAQGAKAPTLPTPAKEADAAAASLIEAAMIQPVLFCEHGQMYRIQEDDAIGPLSPSSELFSIDRYRYCRSWGSFPYRNYIHGLPHEEEAATVTIVPAKMSPPQVVVR